MSLEPNTNLCKLDPNTNLCKLICFRMPKDEIGAYLEAKLSDGEVLREFERIPKKKFSADATTMFKTATMAENVQRNRFKDVLPYDENRVRLAGGDKVVFMSLLFLLFPVTSFPLIYELR